MNAVLNKLRSKEQRLLNTLNRVSKEHKDVFNEYTETKRVREGLELALYNSEHPHKRGETK